MTIEEAKKKMEKENWYNLTAEETAKKLETDLKNCLICLTACS